MEVVLGVVSGNLFGTCNILFYGWFLLRGGSWKGSWLSNLSKEVLLGEISADQCREILYINAQKFVAQCKERRYSMHRLSLHQRTENRYIKEQNSLHKRTEIRYINAHIFVSQCAKIRCIYCKAIIA